MSLWRMTWITILFITALVPSPIERIWTMDEPVDPNRHWTVPMPQLNKFKEKVLEGHFVLVHGHSRSGKTSHRWALSALLQSSYTVLHVQFQDLKNFTLPEFWSLVSSQLSRSVSHLPLFQNDQEFVSIFNQNKGFFQKPVVLLFDEFQQLITRSDYSKPMLTALKQLRDNKKLNTFHACIAFGTLKIVQLATITSTPREISPFDIANQINLQPFAPQLFRNVLENYHASLGLKNFNKQIIDDILAMCGGHVGLFGLCGGHLSEMIKYGHFAYLSWLKKKSNLYLQMFDRAPFRTIIDTLENNHRHLYSYIRSNDMLFCPDNNNFGAIQSNELDELIDIGALVELSSIQAVTKVYSWSAPYVRDFVVQYCHHSLINFHHNTPIPTLQNSKEIDWVTFTKIIMNHVDTHQFQSQYALTTDFQSYEITFHAEWYHVLKGLFSASKGTLIGDFHMCQVVFEAHVIGDRRRYDLFIHNGERTVLELKVNATTRLRLYDAYKQAFKYGEIIEADKVIVVNFLNGYPSDFGNDITLWELVGDDMDLDIPLLDTCASVHLLHIVLSENWEEVVNVLLRDVI